MYILTWLSQAHDWWIWQLQQGSGVKTSKILRQSAVLWSPKQTFFTEKSSSTIDSIVAFSSSQEICTQSRDFFNRQQIRHCVICTINNTNYPHHLITFAATLLSSPPSSALITILPSMSPPLRPLCIHSAFINAIIHLRPFFDRLPIIYVVSSFQA